MGDSDDVQADEREVNDDNWGAAVAAYWANQFCRDPILATVPNIVLRPLPGPAGEGDQER